MQRESAKSLGAKPHRLSNDAHVNQRWLVPANRLEGDLVSDVVVDLEGPEMDPGRQPRREAAEDVPPQPLLQFRQPDQDHREER